MHRRPLSALRLAPLLLVLGAFAAALALSGCTRAYEDEGYYQDEYYEDEEPAPSDEFDDLDFWGQWFDLSPYGQVWRPTVVMGWRPYANGQWLWTDMGWSWVSYEPFGWATYHYGFWAHDFVWGWIWLPGYDWHPSRVEWAVYDDYIAWAPLPPPGFAIHDPWAELEIEIWHVVPVDHFTDNDVDRYHIKYKDRASKKRSVVKYKAPDVQVVEGSTRRTLRPVKVELVGVTRGSRVERMKLPEEEAKLVERYREQTVKRIRPADAPTVERKKRVRDDRARPKRVDPPADEPREKPVVKKPAKKEKPEARKSVKKAPVKKKAEEKEPEKKDPEEKEPEKKEPEKKPVKEGPTKRPRKG